jgi:protein-L-isoaspartate(D-aspartate) O-methyltransferase
MMDERKHERLVKTIRQMGIRTERLYEAVGRIDRADFVPPGLSPRAAYQDAPVSIGEGQTTSQPSLVAQMVDALELEPSNSALEIGTGFGYQTALLASICARVVSIERSGDLARQAHTNIAAAGFDNVRVVTGDGTKGVPEEAPFDGIVVSAAAPEVPPALLEQLAEGGRMVIPIGPGGREEIIIYEKREGTVEAIERMTLAAFVPLVPE